MKTKISYVLACFLMLGFFAANAQSQNGNTPEMRTSKIVIEMVKACNLSADQQSKMSAVILEREKQKDADIAQYSNNPEGMKAATKARNQKAKQAALTIMSQEQLNAWKAYRKQKKEAMEEKRENPNPAPQN
ncbi:MAG: hypothetical protein ABI199_08370 [Bacteroidia bacterium]